MAKEKDEVKAESKPKTLAAKLCGVMRRVGAIEKKGFNAHHRYHYAREADVSDAVRSALVEEGLCLIPSMLAASKEGSLTAIQMSYRLIDAESGETLEFQWFGHAADSQDKGIWKAITGTHKYALSKLFCIGFDDADPENESDSPARPLVSDLEAGLAVRKFLQPNAARPAPQAKSEPQQGAIPMGMFQYKIPFEAEDLRRAVKAAGAKWNGSAKAWEINTRISVSGVDMDKYLVGHQPTTTTDDELESGFVVEA